MASKYYAVRKGRTPGIYGSWAECQKQISGFSGAVYKSFTSRAEAEAFCNMNPEKKDPDRQVDLVAYVDGSYNKVTHGFSYGMVIFDGGQEVCFAEKYEHHPFADMRNVAGEIIGAEKAMRYCYERGKKNIDLYYDYEGISKWCTGEWKTNKEGTQRYKAFYDQISKHIDVRFVKVKGHSGDRYNDLADQLAKDALFSNKVYKMTVATEGKEEKSVAPEVQQEKVEAPVVESTSDEQGSSIFDSLKGGKTSFNLGVLTERGMITEKDLLPVIKEKWKLNRRLQKDIKEIKGFFAVNSNEFVLAIDTVDGEQVIMQISLTEL